MGQGGADEFPLPPVPDLGDAAATGGEQEIPVGMEAGEQRPVRVGNRRCRGLAALQVAKLQPHRVGDDRAGRDTVMDVEIEAVAIVLVGFHEVLSGVAVPQPDELEQSPHRENAAVGAVAASHNLL